MTARIYREVVNPGKLDETQRGNLASELYAIHARIFHGVQYESFAREVIHSTARLTRIAIYRNRQHEIVGYCAVHFHDSEVFQYSKACVIRAESGILQEYRGSNQSIPFLTRQVLRYKLLNPGKRLLFLDTLIHPSSYALVTKYVDDVWPCHCDLESHHVKFLEHLIAQFSFKRSSNDPLVVDTGWTTTEADHERARWTTHSNPNVRFFLDRNPEYHKGNGLITVFPITLKNIFTATRRFKRSSSVKRKQHQRYNAASAKVGNIAL
ncbi:hypothetical protein FA482_16565 [Pseudomonas aeruginosa]|nr:hypothetical protein [Pseudomonas aeruginosa]